MHEVTILNHFECLNGIPIRISVNAALTEIMKADKFLKVLVLVCLAMSWTISGALRRLRLRLRSKVNRNINKNPIQMWPQCSGMDSKLVPLVKSAIMGHVSKKLLQKCEYGASIPQLEEWRETVNKKLDDHLALDVIDWLYNQLQTLQQTKLVPDDTTVNKRSFSKEVERFAQRWFLDSEGPPAPSYCHDYRDYVQIVDDEDVNDDDWGIE